MANCHRNRRESWMWVCRLWKMALILVSVSNTVEDAQRLCGTKELEQKTWNKPIVKLHFIFEFYLGAACWKFLQSDLESQANSRNGMDFEILTYSSESHGNPFNFSLFVESWSKKLVIINARFDALKLELLPYVRGCLMPFLHYSDI
jgi:hypothetical protein